MSDAPLDGQQFLFQPSEFPPLDDLPAEPNIPTIDRPVWTDNKAHFIMRYLRYFVFITKHGPYIDGFAGPQEERMCDTWAARLVLESEPRWMRHFHLCDEKHSQVALLEQLKISQPLLYASGEGFRATLPSIMGISTTSSTKYSPRLTSAIEKLPSACWISAPLNASGQHWKN